MENRYEALHHIIYSVITGIRAQDFLAAAISPAVPSRWSWASFSGLVNGQHAPINFLCIKGINGLLCLCVVRHFDEAESSGPSGHPVHNDRGVLYFTELGKKFPQLVPGCLISKVTNINVHTKLLLLIKFATGTGAHRRIRPDRTKNLHSRCRIRPKL
jgi:hypothetical protein